MPSTPSQTRSAPSKTWSMRLLAIPRWIANCVRGMFGRKKKSSDNPNIYPFF